MTDRAERTLVIIASLLVIVSAMLDPEISVGLAVTVLLGYAVYKLAFRKHT